MCALSVLAVLWFFWCTNDAGAVGHVCNVPLRWRVANVPHNPRCALLPSETRNEAAFSRQASHSEGTTKPHPRRIQPTTKAHPTSLSVDDHQGQWLTVSDNDVSNQGKGRAAVSLRRASARKTFGSAIGVVIDDEDGAVALIVAQRKPPACRRTRSPCSARAAFSSFVSGPSAARTRGSSSSSAPV